MPKLSEFCWRKEMVQTLIRGVDASIPGAPLPAGTLIVAGYVGAPELQGIPDTPHIWTQDEWNIYLDPKSHLYGGPALRALPIFTHDYIGNAKLDAANAVDAMTDLGWHHGFRVLGWDSEFLIAKAYEDELAGELWDLAGWSLLPYGVARTITQVPPPDHSPGVWAAALQPQEPRFIPPGWAGQQWKFGSEWDYDVFTHDVYNMCGQGPRRSLP
jgi:hypothetical protein